MLRRATVAGLQVQPGRVLRALKPLRGHRVQIALAHQHVRHARAPRPRPGPPGRRAPGRPASTVRTFCPTATTSAQASRRPTAAVAGIRMPPPRAALALGGVLPHQHTVVQHADGQLVVGSVLFGPVRTHGPERYLPRPRRTQPSSPGGAARAPRAGPPRRPRRATGTIAPGAARRPPSTNWPCTSRRPPGSPRRTPARRCGPPPRRPWPSCRRRSSSGAPAPPISSSVAASSCRLRTMSASICAGVLASDTALPPSLRLPPRSPSDPVRVQSDSLSAQPPAPHGTPVSLASRHPSTLRLRGVAPAMSERLTARRHRPRLHPARRRRQRGLPRRPQGPQGHRLLLPGRPDPRLHQAGLRLHRQPRPAGRRRLRRHRRLPGQAGEARQVPREGVPEGHPASPTRTRQSWRPTAPSARRSSTARPSTGVIRSTVVVDEDGKVERAFYNVKATGHVAKLIKDLGV